MQCIYVIYLYGCLKKKCFTSCNDVRCFLTFSLFFFFLCLFEMRSFIHFPPPSSSLVAIPVYVKHNITFREGSSQGRFDLTLGPKQTMGKAVESVLVSSQLPRGVLNANLNPSQGTYTFDPVTKVLL